MKNRSWIKRILLKLFPGKHIQDDNIVPPEINAVNMEIHYYTSLEEINLKTDEDNFVAIIDNIRSSTDLFNVCYKQLEFPEYFGFNWNALLDCLSDFSWLTQKNVILIHINLDLLPLDTLYNYIGVLYDCYVCTKKYLEKYPERYPEVSEIHTYFHIKYKEYIDKSLNEIIEKERERERKRWLNEHK